MVTMASPSAGGSLPEEIIVEILTRLPVKSLCRFRCVSSGWLSIISDPQFIEAHFTRSSADPKFLILITVHSAATWRKEEHFFVADYPKQGQWNILSTFSNRIFSKRRRMHDLSRSCGGLILCHDSGNGAIRIINPSTRESAPVDLGSGHHPKPRGLFWLTTASFGFDPVYRNHKILSTGKLSTLYETGWRKISSLPRFKVDTSYPYLCINGAIYYIGRLTKSDETRCLMMFEVRSESFRIIPLPKPIMSFISCARTSFIEYKERLAILDYSSSVSLPRREILLWILEGLDEPLWNCKRILVPPDLVERSPVHKLFFIGSLRGGAELVFLPHYSDFSYLFFYNLEDYSHRKVEVHGLLDCPWQLGFNISVCDHIESLRPVT